MVINAFDPQYIAEVGFPIAAFVAAFGIVALTATLIIKNQIKRQEKFDAYYYKNLDDRLHSYEKSLEDVHNELTNIFIELQAISTRIDTYFRPKSVAYIFKDGKINKIKNIIEEKEIQEIEREIQNMERDSRN